MSEKPTSPCPKCDDLRRREGSTHLLGRPCDICAGRGLDYLGRPCRHCVSFSGPDMPNEDELEDALLQAARGMEHPLVFDGNEA